MPFHKTRALALTAILLASVSGAGIAYADGMPNKTVKQTTLDQAIEEVENKEPPVAIVAEPPAEIETDEPVAVAPVPEEKAPPVPESRIVEVQPNTSFFGLSVGMYDPFSHGNSALALNAEFQPGVKIAGVLQPLFGAMVSTEGTMFGYGGIGIPFRVTDNIFVMPSIAVGAYKEGAGFDLGQTLAFRAGAEVAYEFDDRSRLGINAHIITNGESLGKSDRTEVIALTYTTPMDILAGGTTKANLGE